MLIKLCVWNSRHTDEGRSAAVEEGAVDDLHDEGEVLKLQQRDGGADGKQEALQRRHGQRDDWGPQVCVLLALSYKVSPAEKVSVVMKST